MSQDAENGLERPSGLGGKEGLDEYLALMVSVTQDFATSLDIDETLRRTTERTMEFLGAEAASLFLLEGAELVCRACAGPIDISGMRIPADRGIVGKTVRDSRCYRVRDVRYDPDFAPAVDRRTGFATRSLLSAPLRVGDSCIGAIELINKRGGDGLFGHRDEHTMTVLAGAAALAIHNARMALALIEQERLKHELALAREIQRGLLPVDCLPDSSVAGYNLPAREVSGDFYDYMHLMDGRILFNIGDVAGKGMDASLLMAKTSSLLRCLGKTSASPGQLLGQINGELCDTARRGKFVTVVVGVYDPRDRSVTLANAGHQPPLLRSPEGYYREVPALAPPVGVLPGIVYAETRVELGDGCLYLFTDGLTEAMGTSGHRLEVAGVRRCIEPTIHLAPRERVRAILQGVADAAKVLRDDATLLLLEADSRWGRYTRRTPNPSLRSTRLEAPGGVRKACFISHKAAPFRLARHSDPSPPKPRFDVRRVY